MKAILIKFLPCTDTQCSRLKAITDCHSITVARNHQESDEQARELAEYYRVEMKWDNVKITGFGTLPNGDYVATLGNVNTEGN